MYCRAISQVDLSLHGGPLASFDVVRQISMISLLVFSLAVCFLISIVRHFTCIILIGNLHSIISSCLGVRAIESWCSCCHHYCEDDEEEECDQQVFQFCLCHSKSAPPIWTHPFKFSASNASSNGLCLILSFFGMKEFCGPYSCRKVCGNFRSGFEVSSCFHWSSLTMLIVAHQRDGALVQDHNGVVTLPSCSSSGIHCFPMVSLPLSFAVSFTS